MTPADRLTSIIAKEVGWLNPCLLTDDRDGDLRLNCCDRLCLANALEHEFRIDVPDADAECWSSFNDILRSIERLTRERV